MDNKDNIMYSIYEYFVEIPGIMDANGKPFRRRQIELIEVDATLINGTEKHYGIMPVGDLPNGNESLKYFPTIKVLGNGLYTKKSQGYSSLMRYADHEKGSWQYAIKMQDEIIIKWRKKWEQELEKEDE